MASRRRRYFRGRRYATFAIRHQSISSDVDPRLRHRISGSISYHSIQIDTMNSIHFIDFISSDDVQRCVCVCVCVCDGDV